MPVYLLHGFRWPRPLIRIHIIFQNLDDAAAEWLVAPQTTLTLLQNFHEVYPDCMEHLHQLRFVEQYDPSDISSGASSQPYAYVADVCEEIKLGLDVEDVRGRGLSNDQWAAMLDLRDKLAPDEKVGWYVVVCGDEQRWAPPTMGLLDAGGSVRAPSANVSSASSSQASQGSSGPNGKSITPPGGRSRSLKKFLSQRLGRRKSRQSIHEQLHGNGTVQQKPAPPPILPTKTFLAQPPSGPAKSGRSPAQTSNLQNVNGLKSASVTHLPPILQADEEHEVILGSDDIQEDDQCAPPPVVKSRASGLSAEIAAKKHKRRSLPSFGRSSTRAASPDMIRPVTTLPHHSNTFAAQQQRAQSPSQQQAIVGGAAISDIPTLPYRRSISPVSTPSEPDRGTPSLISSISARPPRSILSSLSTDSPARSRSPNKAMYHSGYPTQAQRASSHGRPSSLIQTTPNASALNLAHALPPNLPFAHKRTEYSPSHLSLAASARPSGEYTTGRNSLTALPDARSSMSPAKGKRASRSSLGGSTITAPGIRNHSGNRASRQSFGAGSTVEEGREWGRHRQSVMPEELVARGLDEGVFAGLK